MENRQRPWRWIWMVGLLAYMAGGFFFMMTPFVVPLVGGLVVLACASAQGKGASDDRFIMGSAMAELAIYGVLLLGIQNRPHWAEWPATILFFIGVLLPLIVIVYAMTGRSRAWT